MSLVTKLAGNAQLAGQRKNSALSNFWRWEASGILVALVVLVLVLSFATENFLTSYNMTVVARQAAFVGREEILGGK